MSERLRIVIPHRGLRVSKTRLAPVLSADERTALATRLLTRVLDVARQAAEDVVVISPAADLAPIVAAAGARLEVQRGMGLNEGLDQARRDALASGVEVLLVLHGDLPNLRVEEIRHLLAACPAPRGVSIAPDRAGTGTNGLCLRPADAIGFDFGAGSFARHAAEADAAGLPLEVVRAPGLDFDLDTPQDLARWLEMGDAA